jgi:hypothetical protein
MNYSLQFELEDDGRWIAEIVSLPGAMAYGDTKHESGLKAHAIANDIIAANAPKLRTIERL